MDARRRLAVVILTTLVLAACSEPFVMLPGGELSGTLKPPPKTWQFTHRYEDVQLETRPDDPYSVNVWGVGFTDGFYVAAGGGLESTWASHIEADPRVRLRVGDDLFELRAERVERAIDLRKFRAGLHRKYDGYEPDAEQQAKAVVYRLVPR